MSFKKMLVTWFKLAALLAAIAFSHAILHTQGAAALAELLAPQYAALSPTQAQAILEERIREAKAWRAGYKARCEYDWHNQVFPARMRDCLQNGAQALKEDWKPALAEVYSEHAKAYRTNEIDARVEMLRTYAFPWFFGVIYALLVLLALRALLHWFVGRALPVMRLRLAKVVLVARQLRARSTSRSMRRAAREFADLNTLHQHGLISEAVFLKQKAALTAALKENPPADR